MTKKQRNRRDIVKRSPHDRARSDLLAFIEALGIMPAFRTIPSSQSDRVFEKACLPPIVTLDRTLAGDRAAEEIAERLRTSLRGSKLVLEKAVHGSDLPVSMHCVYSSLANLDFFLRRFTASQPAHSGGAECLSVVERIVKQSKSAASSFLEDMTLAALMPEQRFEHKLYGVRITHMRLAVEAVRLELQLFSERARKEDIEFEGAKRPAWQCGGFIRPSVIDWIGWSPKALGVSCDQDESDRPRPVFVQSHAIGNFYARLGVPPSQNELRTLMFQSLLKPSVIATRPDGTLLIECKSEVGRLGYFVASFLGDRFLIHTFLFLTMSGTPEAARIYERLHVNRNAVEMMKLDDLATYVISDVREDRKLVEVLSECGCAHLFKIKDRLPFEVPALMRQADDLRRILGWR